MNGRDYLELASACVACNDEVEFEHLVDRRVRPLLPHRSLVAGLGRVELDEIEIAHLVNVGAPLGQVARVPRRLALQERPALSAWLLSREPVVLSFPADAARMSARERWEMAKFDLRRIAVHGLLDTTARAGSYFCFARVQGNLNAESVRTRLRLIVPLLHVAFVNAQKGAERTQSRRATLTAAEQELLGYLCSGRTNAEIARQRERSLSTLQNQLHALYRKLGVRNRMEAVRLTMRPTR